MPRKRKEAVLEAATPTLTQAQAPEAQPKARTGRPNLKVPHLVALAPAALEQAQEAEQVRGEMTPRLASRERQRIELEAVTEMNDTHATYMNGGNTFVVCERRNGEHQLTTFRALSEWLANKPLYVSEYDERAERVVPKRLNRVLVWRDHEARRNIEGLEFAPGKDLGPDYYNTWKGWPLAPIHDGGAAAEPIIQHIASVWCGNDPTLSRWVCAWFAQMVQNPCSKPGTALVLRGQEGTGKGILAGQLMRRLLGSAFVQIAHPGQVTGRFNAIWQSRLFAFVDEAFWAGDKPSEGVLKGLITEPRINVEFKGKDCFEIDNHARVLFASNNSWVVPAGETARRFCVLDVDGSKRGDTEYFKVLSDCVAGDGAASFLGFLLNLDISDVDLRTPPVTGALMEQKLMTLDSVPAWWRERLWSGFIDNPEDKNAIPDAGTDWPLSVPCSRLFASYAAFCKRQNARYPESEERLAVKLRQFASIERKRGAVDGNGKRPWVYQFGGRGNGNPLYDLRGQFEQWIGGAVEWEGDERQADDDDHQVEAWRTEPVPSLVDECPF